MGAELRTAGEIRRLSADQIASRPAVVINGRVTFVTLWSGRSEVSLQDETAGIYTYLKNADVLGLKLGDEVEVRGTARPGIWAPCLEAESVVVKGRRSLPEAGVVDYPELKSGSRDCEFVEIEGIVRDVQYDGTVAPPSTIFSVAMRGGRGEVFLSLPQDPSLQELVDSRVRVRGVPFHYFNQRRQVFEFRLMTCERSQIEVLEPAPSKPFEMPVTRVGRLLQYEPEGDSGTSGHSGHRVRVQGVVSLHWPGEFLFLQDGEDGLLVRSRRLTALKAGDRVDVAAFASMGKYAAFLEDAEFRKMDSGMPPKVVAVPLEELATGDADARLVETQGALESVSERNGRAFLMLRKGSLIVPAELPVPMMELPSILSGSLVKVTGICQVELGSQRQFARSYKPEGARLLLRSVGDVVVVRSAPWWTTRRLQLALTGLGVVLVIAMVWAWSLQSRNARLKREMTARERAEAEVKRREEERNLLAADLHDSLEQSLTGVALQLQAAKNQAVENGRSPHLALAERLLKHSREEVHRAVRDLRQPAREAFDLPMALRSLIRRAAVGSKVAFDLDLPEAMPELPGNLSHQVLHLVQEGVTNALKHADASSIRIELKRDAAGIRLEVADDGNGFDQASHPGPAEGHFGMQGMKERAARLGGTLEVDSVAGTGTRIKVVLPITA